MAYFMYLAKLLINWQFWHITVDSINEMAPPHASLYFECDVLFLNVHLSSKRCEFKNIIAPPKDWSLSVLAILALKVLHEIEFEDEFLS